MLTPFKKLLNIRTSSLFLFPGSVFSSGYSLASANANDSNHANDNDDHGAAPSFFYRLAPPLHPYLLPGWNRCEREVCCVTWHGKGDYLASVSQGESRQAVMIHQVSKASTQCPFRRTKASSFRLSVYPTPPYSWYTSHGPRPGFDENGRFVLDFRPQP